MKTMAERAEEARITNLANKEFDEAHHTGAYEFGIYWLRVHLDVSHELTTRGFDTSKPLIKALAAIVVLVTLRNIKKHLPDLPSKETADV